MNPFVELAQNWRTSGSSEVMTNKASGCGASGPAYKRDGTTERRSHIRPDSTKPDAERQRTGDDLEVYPYGKPNAHLGRLLARSSTLVGIMDNMARLRSRDLFPSEEPVRPPGKLIAR